MGAAAAVDSSHGTIVVRKRPLLAFSVLGIAWGVSTGSALSAPCGLTGLLGDPWGRTVPNLLFIGLVLAGARLRAWDEHARR
jgi:hypothetical protein